MSQSNIVAPVKATTQQFVEIEAIDDDVVLMSDRRCCCIIQTNGVNFQLLSPEEQSAIVSSFSQLLNSLSFPIQISIISKKTDVFDYLGYLESLNHEDQSRAEYLESYKEFIKSTVKQNSIIEKNFYVVIPFSPLEMGAVALKKTDATYVFTRAKASLYPKKDHVLKLLEKSNLGGRVLKEQEIVELFYDLFNPSQTGRNLGPIKTYTNLITAK